MTTPLAYSATTGAFLGQVVGSFRGNLLIAFGHRLTTAAPATVTVRAS